MSSKKKTPDQETNAGLKQEIDALKKQLEHHEHVEKMHHDVITDVSKAIHRLDSFENTAALIFQACKKAIGARSGYIALLTPDGKENSVLYLDAGGLPCNVDPSLPMPIRGLRAEAYKSKRPAIDNNFKDSKWMQFMPAGHVGLKTVMFAPMVIGEEAKGLFGLANKPGGFTDEDAEIAMSYAEIGAIALQSSEMIEDIKKANDNLQEAYQDASFLKDLIVHDMNNNLQAISSAVELWKLKVAKGLPATGMTDSLVIISDNITRGAELITSIQKLERLVDPKLACESNDIIKPLKEAVEILRKRFPSRQLDISIDEGEGNILAYSMELVRDAFENILINAVRHNNNPTAVIRIAVRREFEGETPVVRLEFVDNGIGIEDERKATIFDRVLYKQRSKTGLGIGLSVVKRIITRCGGKIWVEDAVKGDRTRGSKVIITLPAGATDAPSSHHP